MTTKKDYTADDIKVLDDREHVRLRLMIYMGSTKLTEYQIPFFNSDGLSIESKTFVPAVFKAVNEVIDNSIDEFAQTNQKNKTLTITADPEKGEYTISDNGRGVPIDTHETGVPTPQVVFSSLRSGRNFSDQKSAGVIGMNGVGVSCVNYCSTEFSVVVERNNQQYTQTFTNGAEHASKPSIKNSQKKTSKTQVSFKLDPSLFEDVSLDPELMRNRAMEVAASNPDITVEYNGEKFRFRKGFEDLIKHITDNNEQSDYYKFEYHPGGGTKFEFFVVDGIHQGDDEKMFTWVNSSLLFDGGICNTQFLNALMDRTTNYLSSRAKKNKCEITKNDVRKNLLVFGNLVIANPEYDAQSKTRLTGPSLRKEFDVMINQQWRSFSKKFKPWFEQVLQRAIDRSKRQGSKQARKEVKDRSKKKIPGLTDATSTDRSRCQLLVTEGDSASSQITEVRNPETTASYALTGKINNVHNTSPDELLKMEKLTNLLAAIGLVPGQPADRNNLRYRRVISATDADPDGADIFSLETNVFFRFWPELFDPNEEPFFYRLIAPNVVASKGKQRIHFPTKQEFEKVKDQYKMYTIEYMKGLGSMSEKDWEIVLSEESNTMIPIVDDGQMGETLELLFNEDADARKQWLMENTTDE